MPKSNANRMEDHWLMGEQKLQFGTLIVQEQDSPEAGQNW